MIRFDINYGIKTGYNAAFIIDSKLRAEIIAQDPKSAEIIKPVLRGRDIQRYQAQWAGQWLIDTHNGYGKVPPIHVDDYPAVKKHLNQYYERLALRKDKGRTPYNLRNCSYHAQFKKEKLFWMHMSPRGRFAYSDSEIYCNQKAFFLTGHFLKYLCAILNSTIVTWFIGNTAVTTGMGLTQWDKFVVEKVAIPKVAISEQRQFVDLVERILSVKADSPSADTSSLENEIDGLVNSLYELSPQETVLLNSIERKLKTNKRNF